MTLFVIHTNLFATLNSIFLARAEKYNRSLNLSNGITKVETNEYTLEAFTDFIGSNSIARFEFKNATALEIEYDREQDIECEVNYAFENGEYCFFGRFIENTGFKAVTKIVTDGVLSGEKSVKITDCNHLEIRVALSVDDERAEVSAEEYETLKSAHIKAFEKEAISAGREYSNYRMNQCISVSIYGLSLMAFAKKLIIFAGISYISLMLFHISRKFPKKA